MTRPFWSDLWNLCVAWWRVDRIRASPANGRLLRLEPGAVLVIRGEHFVVTQRERQGESDVRYMCRGREACSVLVAPVYRGEIEWSCRGQTTTVFAEQIEVYRERGE